MSPLKVRIKNLINNYINKNSDLVEGVKQIEYFSLKYLFLTITIDEYMIGYQDIRKIIKISLLRLTLLNQGIRFALHEMYDKHWIRDIMCSPAYLSGNRLMASFTFSLISLTVFLISMIIQYHEYHKNIGISNFFIHSNTIK